MRRPASKPKHEASIVPSGDAVEFLERVSRASRKPQASFVRLLTEAEAAEVPRRKPRPRRAG